jgi:hypothetical protein
MKNAAPARAASSRCNDPASAILSLPAVRNQAPPPLERYEPLVLFELPAVHRLAGHVQGPGRLGDLLRAGGRP